MCLRRRNSRKEDRGNIHADAGLTLVRRVELVGRMESGSRPQNVVAAFGVSRRTVYKWLARRRKEEELFDKSSRPHHSPTALQPRTIG
ncbi:leucine zipper domain-containing protein [Pseudodesulfovibrio sp.]|uniref:leucine zipper domain-containing protein n=1 Tax=Pseudodesulfovibrio sp. TaxID=2035812 RepID=UPI0034401962